MPQTLHVVTSVTETDAQGDSYVTGYAYANPVFDPANHALLGFGDVEVDHASFATHTTYMYPTCPVLSDGVDSCPSNNDYLFGAFRGLPTVEDTFVRISPSMYLSNTHHSYNGIVLYPSMDGRQVTRAWDAMEDTYLYDTPRILKGAIAIRTSIPDAFATFFSQPGKFTVRDRGFAPAEIYDDRHVRERVVGIGPRCRRN